MEIMDEIGVPTDLYCTPQMLSLWTNLDAAPRKSSATVLAEKGISLPWDQGTTWQLENTLVPPQIFRWLAMAIGYKGRSAWIYTVCPYRTGKHWTLLQFVAFPGDKETSVLCTETDDLDNPPLFINYVNAIRATLGEWPPPHFEIKARPATFPIGDLLYPIGQK